MAAKKKKTTARRRAPKQPDYPFLTLSEYGALSPQEKIKYIEVLKSEPSKPNPNLAHLFKESPKLIERGIEIYRERFGVRSGLTPVSMWAHIGLLVVGTAAMVTLGAWGVLEGAAIVGVLGPLYTYVLVNLRYLTGWKMVGDSGSET